MRTRLEKNVYRIEKEADQGYPDGWYYKDNHMCFNGPFETAEEAFTAYDRSILSK